MICGREAPGKHELARLNSFCKQVRHLMHELLPRFSAEGCNCAWFLPASRLVIDQIVQAFLNCIGPLQRMLRSEHPPGVHHGSTNKLERKVVPLPQKKYSVRFLQVPIRKQMYGTHQAAGFQDRLRTFVPRKKRPPVDSEESRCFRDRIRGQSTDILSLGAYWLLRGHFAITLVHLLGPD